MREISISEIRNKAQSLIALNQGYVMYQKHEYSNLEFRLSQYRGITIEAEATFFDGTKAALAVGEDAKGNCTCNSKPLCKHEICLYFLIKDYSLTIKEEDLSSDINASNGIEYTMTSFIDEQKENFNVYHVSPVFEINNNSIFLSLILKNASEQIYMFGANMINDIEAKKYTLDLMSTTFINYIKNVSQNNTQNECQIDASSLDIISKLYKDETIYIRNNFMNKPAFFKYELNEKPFYYKNYDFGSKFRGNIFISDANSYIFKTNEIFVLDNKKYKKLIGLLSINNNSEVLFSFDKDHEDLFYINIYDGLEDYIDIKDSSSPYHYYIDSKILYDKGVLSLEYFPKLYQGNKIVKEGEIISLKLANYKNYLKYLGLDDNNSLTNIEKIGNFLTESIDELKKYGKVYISDNIRNIKKISSNNFHFKMNFDMNFCDVIFNDLNYSEEELAYILQSYRENKHFIALESGEILSLDNDLNVIESFMDDLNINTHDLYSPIKLSTCQIFNMNSIADLIDNKKEFNEFCSNITDYDNYEVLIPSSLEEILRPYQVKAVKWLSVLTKFKMGGILADDMGLGKTVEMISLFSSMKRENPCLIVAPTSLIFNWQAEFEKFAPSINVKVIFGPAEDRCKMLKNIKQDDIIITSYEVCRLDVEYYEKMYFDIIAVDEAQYIKNPQALKTLALKQLHANAKFALTGTPIENSILDLWSIFDFVLPNYLGDRKEFLRRYASLESGDDSNLLKKIRPFLLRREKENVLDLPPKIENFSYAVMSKEQEMEYARYLTNAQKELQESNYKIANVLNILMRLREFACEPKLFIENYSKDNAKLNLFMEIVKESIADNHRILVFTQFTSMFPYIEECLKKDDIEYLQLSGQTPADERKRLVDLFNNDRKYKIFLISLKAGGNGLNLVGADTVIHYDPWWNVAAMNQATDRCYRIGQTKEVHVIKLIVKNTIEDKIVELQRKKKNLSDSYIQDESVLTSLSKEEIKKLFTK